MFFHNTDREWKRWDKRDLYFAVLSHPEYRDRRNMENFFATGENNFARLSEVFRQLAIPLDPSGKALDYGCGVGRLLRPFGSFFQHTLGIDVSQNMLEEASRNIDLDTAELRLFDGEDLSRCLSDNTFSFIHTRLVFQHIRPKRGFGLIRQLLERLEKNGKAYIQAPMLAKSKMVHLLDQIRCIHPIAFKLSEVFLKKDRTLADPVSEMNIYPSDTLLTLFDDLGIEVRGVTLDTNRNLTGAVWYLYRP
jgi:SAM-dependent methyltransferase